MADNDERPSPELVGPGFVQVVAGRMASCARTREDRIFCCGENAAGQLGVADNDRRNALTEVAFP
jgi:hypothetical protein